MIIQQDRSPSPEKKLWDEIRKRNFEDEENGVKDLEPKCNNCNFKNFPRTHTLIKAKELLTEHYKQRHSNIVNRFSSAFENFTRKYITPNTTTTQDSIQKKAPEADPLTDETINEVLRQFDDILSDNETNSPTQLDQFSTKQQSPVKTKKYPTNSDLDLSSDFDSNCNSENEWEENLLPANKEPNHTNITDTNWNFEIKCPHCGITFDAATKKDLKSKINRHLIDNNQEKISDAVFKQRIKEKKSLQEIKGRMYKFACFSNCKLEATSLSSLENDFLKNHMHGTPRQNGASKAKFELFKKSIANDLQPKCPYCDIEFEKVYTEDDARELLEEHIKGDHNEKIKKFNTDFTSSLDDYIDIVPLSTNTIKQVTQSQNKDTINSDNKKQSTKPTNRNKKHKKNVVLEKLSNNNEQITFTPEFDREEIGSENGSLESAPLTPKPVQQLIAASTITKYASVNSNIYHLQCSLMHNIYGTSLSEIENRFYGHIHNTDPNSPKNDQILLKNYLEKNKIGSTPSSVITTPNTLPTSQKNHPTNQDTALPKKKASRFIEPEKIKKENIASRMYVIYCPVENCSKKEPYQISKPTDLKRNFLVHLRKDHKIAKTTGEALVKKVLQSPVHCKDLYHYCSICKWESNDAPSFTVEEVRSKLKGHTCFDENITVADMKKNLEQYAKVERAIRPIDGLTIDNDTGQYMFDMARLLKHTTTTTTTTQNNNGETNTANTQLLPAPLAEQPVTIQPGQINNTDQAISSHNRKKLVESNDNLKLTEIANTLMNLSKPSPFSSLEKPAIQTEPVQPSNMEADTINTNSQSNTSDIEIERGYFDNSVNIKNSKKRSNPEETQPYKKHKVTKPADKANAINLIED